MFYPRVQRKCIVAMAIKGGFFAMDEKQKGPKSGAVTRRVFGSLAGGVFVAAVTGGAFDGCAPPDGKQEPASEGTQETSGVAEASARTDASSEPGFDATDVADATDATSGESEPAFEKKGPPELPPVELEGRTYVTVELSKHPKMEKVGAAISVSIPNKDFDLVRLKRSDDYEFSAVSLTCTHNGCTIGWRPDKFAFVCPCHVAMFTEEGRCHSGARKTSLKNL